MMYHLAKKQTGMSLVGLVLFFSILSCFILFGVRVFPIYNEYISVNHTMNATLNRPSEELKTEKMVQSVFLLNADVNNLRGFSSNNIKKRLKVIKARKNQPRKLQLKYQIKNIFFGNLYLVMEVDEVRPFQAKKR